MLILIEGNYFENAVQSEDIDNESQKIELHLNKFIISSDEVHQ